MGGGPSKEAKQAAKNEAALAQENTDIARQRNAREQSIYNDVSPYATDRLQNGLPFYNALTDYSSGTNAKAFAPARANIMRMIARRGSDMPSGYGDQLLTDFEAQRARGFDQSLVNNMLTNEQAKRDAAGLLTGEQQLANPSQFYGNAMSGNQVVMNAPRSPGIGGILGGVASGIMKAVPF